MMGYPAGWTADLDLTRTAQLKVSATQQRRRSPTSVAVAGPVVSESEAVAA